MHNRWSGSRLFVSGLVCLTVLAAPAVARAGDGAFGVGARFSLVRGDAAVPGSSADRFSGGLLRLRLSPRTAIEVALDYRSYLNQDLTERIKDMPIQASMLLYPIRAAISPYLLGGVGWYAQTVTMVNTDAPPAPQTTRTMGYHAGVGGSCAWARTRRCTSTTGTRSSTSGPIRPAPPAHPRRARCPSRASAPSRIASGCRTRGRCGRAG